MLDQLLCENFVCKCLTASCAVATSVLCALPFHCLYVPFESLYAALDLVLPEMLSVSLERSSIGSILTRGLDFCLTTNNNSVQKIWPFYISFQGLSPSTVCFCEYCCSSFFVPVSFVHLSV